MASREYSDETPRKDKLNQGLESLSSQELDSLRDECARTALALTALFDGEANVEEALLARTHRDECAQCDFLWQSWNHQNHSLRHISAPVPPALLTRILTAIRLLSAMPQMRARLEAQDDSLRASDWHGKRCAPVSECRFCRRRKPVCAAPQCATLYAENRSAARIAAA